MESLRPLIISIVRTVIMPLVAGALLSLVVLISVENPSAELQAATASLLAICWYLLARWLETKNSYWGVMLLVAVQPSYEDEEGTEQELLTSLLRTVVPLIVGWAITALAKLGFDLDESTAALALQGVITTAYYALIRIIEQSKPVAGVLIGGRTQPTY